MKSMKILESATDTFEDALPPRGSETPAQDHLFVVLECDRLSAGGARYALTGIDEVVIGRGQERSAIRTRSENVNQLTLRVPGRSMSSTHARLARSEEGWTLEDARSTNGSVVNGERVDRVALQDGDVIELGHTLFIIGHVPTPADTPEDFDSFAAMPEEKVFRTLLPELAADFATLARVASSGLSVLLLGETGTGKEVVARAIHRLSGRAGSLVAVNCGALSPNLIESQLFGHVKGAFTGAVRDEPGFFRAAERGTLLLDEVADLPRAAQPVLLRVLQEREVVSVGSAKPVPVDVRVVAATHHPVDSLVKSELFRRDLLARLDGYRFRLPSLRDRIVDIGCIIQSLKDELGEHIKLAPASGFALATHPWSSNIRELTTALRRAAVVADAGSIDLDHLGLSRLENDPVDAVWSRSKPRKVERTTEENEIALRNELLRLLVASNGNIAEVSRSLGKARMQVHRWMKRFGLEPSSFRPERRSGRDC